MKIIKLYGVEHCRNDGAQTYELFRTLNEAENYVLNSKNWNSSNKPLYIFSSDFSSEYVYEEDNGRLNYEDCYGLLQGNYKLIRKINTSFLNKLVEI